MMMNNRHVASLALSLPLLLLKTPPGHGFLPPSPHLSSAAAVARKNADPLWVRYGTPSAKDIAMNATEALVSGEEVDAKALYDFALPNANGNPIQQAMHRFLAAGGGDKIGERGEIYFFPQALLIIGVALGKIPLISDALQTIAGPGMMLLGFAAMVLTALDMGESLTPWPKPNGGGLVTTGLYGQVRHPMYAGLLASLIGFAVWTASIDRLLLVALLVVALEVKSEYEERELAKAYPEYPDYKKMVESKFVPQSLLNMLKKNSDEDLENYNSFGIANKT